jgi:RNA polymerase sporulation-specific sigma factor
MNYKDFNDNELIAYISEHNEEAYEVIFQKYKPFIVGLAKKLIKYCNNLGIDINDLIQEGMLGLNIAINTYNSLKDNIFYTYAKTCIERKMLSLITASRRQKHKILNESLPLESDNDEERLSLYNLISDDSNNPEVRLLLQEQGSELAKIVNNNLTDLEKQVFELKINGFNYHEIAEILDKDLKAIDNASQRIKNKIKQQLNNI